MISRQIKSKYHPGCGHAERIDRLLSVVHWRSTPVTKVDSITLQWFMALDFVFNDQMFKSADIPALRSRHVRINGSYLLPYQSNDFNIRFFSNAVFLLKTTGAVIFYLAGGVCFRKQKGGAIPPMTQSPDRPFQRRRLCHSVLSDGPPIRTVLTPSPAAEWQNPLAEYSRCSRFSFNSNGCCRAKNMEMRPRWVSGVHYNPARSSRYK
jgi:hypothetical protein